MGATTEIQANGMTFTCRTAGPADGEPVILLHGFPETSHMWTALLPVLAEAGYHCIAPDQRGYSAGARPEGVDQYATTTLVSDVMAIADAAGFDRFHLIGHDWGAAVGWRAVMAHPDRIVSWSALSIPHIASYQRAYATDPAQQEKSAYITFFQQVGAAEEALTGNDFAMLRGIWTASSPDEVADYVAVLSQPYAMTAALNWYRAGFGGGAPMLQDSAQEISVPTLTIWGNQDTAVGRSTTETAAQYMKGPYRFVELDAGHWLIQEQFETVRDELLAHLKANPIA